MARKKTTEEAADVPTKPGKPSALLDPPSCIAATTTTVRIDGRIFGVRSEPKAFGSDELGLQQRCYPIQVKQKDEAGRPDIDQFETAMHRAKCAKGFFVSFAFPRTMPSAKSSASSSRSTPSSSPSRCR